MNNQRKRFEIGPVVFCWSLSACVCVGLFHSFRAYDYRIVIPCVSAAHFTLRFSFFFVFVVTLPHHWNNSISRLKNCYFKRLLNSNKMCVRVRVGRYQGFGRFISYYQNVSPWRRAYATQTKKNVESTKHQIQCEMNRHQKRENLFHLPAVGARNRDRVGSLLLRFM